MDERPDRLGRRIAIAETRMSDWVGSVLARAPWLASIRTKIFFGCLVLTLVTIVVGIVSQAVQYSLSDKALGIYDNAFTSMSYLRSAQSIVSNVSRPGAARDDGNVVRIDQLQSALDALDVARERAMSPRGEDLARQLQSAVTEMQAGLITAAAPIADAQFTAVARLFDVAVQVYSGDGFRLRRSIEALVDKAKVYTYAAVLASVAMALAITLLLSRAIVPSLRNAVRIATAIAAGQRDNAIDRHGSSETGALLRALASMQDSIAEKIACIETLMAQQASSHAAEIASQHARFEAALNNMTLGLCMFDPGGALLVHNRRFVEMFVDNASASTDVRGVLMRLGLGGQGAPGERGLIARTSTRALDDGRTIAVSESPMSGGGRVVTYEDVTERQRAEARLSHMARHDALTGLPNRVLFREQVERGLAQGRGDGDVLSLLCLDLDRFKTVNDTLGHPIGDALLREAAARLLNATEGADIVVRLGGDEFAVVQRSSRRVEDARLLAIRLIGALSLPFDIDGHRISIGVSIGIVETMDASDTPDSLLKNADLALYLAKADGRSTYRFFERTMDEQIQAKRRLELDLRTAIDERQFELFYQPLLSTGGGAVVAFEALLRWHHPERGLVSPAEFIPLAEETGLIVELGLWVMNQACRDATHWPDEVKVAINLSPLQFRGADLVGTVAAALRQSGLSGTRLELEITESVMLQDNDIVLSMLHDLRALGVCISMDDFGTGYSSLSYLCRFPFDKIKIDRGFVSNMTMGSDALAVVRAIVNLGRSLRMNVVAEGVETDEQMNLLCEAGCHEVQGYLFSRPQPADAAKALIERFAVARAA